MLPIWHLNFLIGPWKKQQQSNQHWFLHKVRTEEGRYRMSYKQISLQYLLRSLCYFVWWTRRRLLCQFPEFVFILGCNLEGPEVKVVSWALPLLHFEIIPSFLNCYVHALFYQLWKLTKFHVILSSEKNGHVPPTQTLVTAALISILDSLNSTWPAMFCVKVYLIFMELCFREVRICFIWSKVPASIKVILTKYGQDR